MSAGVKKQCHTHPFHSVPHYGSDKLSLLASEGHFALNSGLGDTRKSLSQGIKKHYRMSVLFT